MASLSDYAGDERTARMALSTCVAPADPLTGRIVAAVGAVETVRLLETDSPLPGLDRIEAGVWRGRLRQHVSLDAVEEAVECTRRSGLDVVMPGDDEYPALLDELGHRAPSLLWVKGDIEALRAFSQTFTITGTSNATAYGRQMAHELAVDLVADNAVLVSGGAEGIDATVHQAALNHGGTTIAVLPHGLDRIDAQSNRAQLHAIGEQGLLISEVPPGTGQTAESSRARLRIETALSGSLTVVEAESHSDLTHAVDYARALGVRLGAIPGPVPSSASDLPNALISDRSAQMIVDADALIGLHYGPPPAPPVQSIRHEPELSLPDPGPVEALQRSL